MGIEVHQGDCLGVLNRIPSASVDLVYLDPPFFTQRRQKLTTRDRSREFSFDDRWNSVSQYKSFLAERLVELRRTLKSSGSLFFHCDKTASHTARHILDGLFGEGNFRAEIIWHYRRWSNSARGLLPAHQTILFYSRTKDYKFHSILTDYSPTTNVDQILQRRSRDDSNKSVYARTENGDVIYGGAKEGVPLSDVWSIPFLNPKAKERTGYPTQKPVLLLERIIQIATDPGDVVVDPFCGSGTTLVAAQLLHRSAIGIDVSEEACELSRSRLEQPVKTESNLMKSGVESYKNADEASLALLNSIPHVPVQRNNGIDAFLRETFQGIPIPIRVQKHGETLSEAAVALHKAGRSKGAQFMILIATTNVPGLFPDDNIPDGVAVVPAASFGISKLLSDLRETRISAFPLTTLEMRALLAGERAWPERVR